MYIVYIFVLCALLDIDVASVQRLMPLGNGQVNWVSYSLLCKHIHVLGFIQNFEQRKIIFVIHRSLNTLQNAVEYLHNKSKKKRWQKNSNVSCSVIYYGEHFVLGVAVCIWIRALLIRPNTPVYRLHCSAYEDYEKPSFYA